MDERPFETINVIPFVDIMLVLLAIVLTTASFIATGRIPVSLPQASTTAEKQKDRIIELSAEGEVYLDGKSVSKDLLEERLRELPSETPILIRADRATRFQSFVDVADILKKLKILKVSIQTKSVTP
ncbi:MAG TPA: biopolymer transporter ExbD [Methylocystis sp.]|nr:biopolymer transporter ExbD [Methylocystis sp.]